MEAKNKEEVLLMLIQVLNKSCDDLDYIGQGLNSEKKSLLNEVNKTVLDARNEVQEVLMQDKKDDILVNQLQNELAQVIDFLSENGLIAKFIEYKRIYDE